DGRDSPSASSEELCSDSSSRPASRSSSRKHKSSKLLKSSKSSKESKHLKPAKPSHMRKNIRKLLKEDQLEAGTKAAQQEEMERRKRLEQQRKDFPTHAPAVPEPHLGDLPNFPALFSKQDVICLDSSGEEDEKLEPKLPVHAMRDDVIELSSGDEDSLQVSSESADEEAEGAAGSEESSGAHINDAFNQPDAQGRVLVNINHPSEEKDVFLAPQLAKAVKPHQIGGIRFLYDNLIESLDRYKSSSGFGCILAHSMGLGKTLQVISFIDILLKNTEAHTVLVIVPVNTLQNWLTEFNFWLPPQEGFSSDTDPSVIMGRTFKVYILNDEHKTTPARAKVVEDWSRDGGVLLMGYEMYRLLSMKKSFVMGRKRKSKKPVGPIIIDLDEEDRQQELMKVIEKAITRPGPDVVICDEGHRIKNYHANTSQALKNIRSRRRVVLTGYPLQNNLLEYWCMVDFVRPDFLGTRQEFSNMFERPILNGQCVDSTPQDVRLMRYRSHVLHSLLEGFVQRRGHDVLQHQLPAKNEHVILVRLSPIQRALYTEFMKRFREAGNNGWLGLNPLKAFCVCCKIWNHPDVLYEALQKENQANEQDLDLDDITSASNSRSAGLRAKAAETSNSRVNNALPVNASQERANQVITYEWAKEIMSKYQKGVLEMSAKMVLLFHLIDESVQRRDKLLVFSQSLSTLTVIEDFLSKRALPPAVTSPDSQNQTWVRNLNYYRLDGSTSASERERLINQFNDPENTKTWVFLLSTRAGCLGVNLIGANRVVVFDASWNPCHDAQAVCRVYRYGQRKPCYIYRLVCDFTLEKKIYDRQVTKQGMSDRVVDDLNPVLNFTRKEVESLLHFVEEEPAAMKKSVESREELEPVIAKACRLYPHFITKSICIIIAHIHAGFIRTKLHLSLRRPMTRPDDKPVASVRPIQSTPIPMMPRQVGMGLAGSSAAGSLPVNFLQKAGVYVQRIVTTTDIVIPGANSTTDVQARINAGESIHIIRGSKGTYIRTNDGRIFAIRSGKISRSVVGLPAASRGRGSKSFNGCSSPLDPQPRSPNDEQRPSSPSGSEILRELSCFTSSGDTAPRIRSELPSLSDAPCVRATDEDGSQLFQSSDLSRQLNDNNLLSSVLEGRGTKRRGNEGQGKTQIGAKRSSALNFPSFSVGSSGLSFPPMGTSIPPYLLNPNMANLLSSSFPLTYSQPLLSEPRMFPSPLLSGSGGFSTPSSSSATSSFLSHFNSPTSSLLGAALSQADIHTSAETGGDSSDDDVIEVTGH
uniref:Helicase ARIP4-like n=1 Tax=Gouania willdenowi TaxID=441366 RepID=A0A8C5I4K2_GOUWI